jgi:hypothetical protein
VTSSMIEEGKPNYSMLFIKWKQSIKVLIMCAMQVFGFGCLLLCHHIFGLHLDSILFLKGIGHNWGRKSQCFCSMNAPVHIKLMLVTVFLPNTSKSIST